MKMRSFYFLVAATLFFPFSVSATDVGAVTCSPIASQGSATYNVNVQCSVQVTEGVQGAWFNAYLQDCNNFCASIGRSNTPSPDGFRCTSGENRPWSAIQAGVNYGPTGCWHNCALPEGFAGAASNGYWCYHPSQKRDNDHTDKTVGCYCAKSAAAPQAQLGINKNPASATKLTGVNAVPSNWQSVSVLANNDRPDRIFNLLGVVGYGRSTSFNMTINIDGACGTSAPFTAVLGRADGTYQNRTFFITLPACPPTPACSDGADNDGDGAVDMGDFSCSSPTDTDEGNPKSQCQDGVDNDSDGLVDMNDPACTSNQGNNEGAATSQCQDGIDNDGDGAADFPNDFSCSSATDNNEGDPKSQCQDGIDNDGDGATDFPNDFSCSSKQDNDETNPKSQCQDGIDNDSDGLVDLNDPACANNQGNNEGGATSQCQDGIDNDGDGAADFPNDFSCSSATDNNEGDPKSQCQDGIDNDGDGATDFPNDFSCSSKQDNDETNPKSQCQDGLDNDSDGLVDSNDPACTSSQVNNEGGATSQCQDGIDNDSDGAADFPNDFSCSGPTDTDETNQKSQCQDGIDNDGDGAVDFPADFSCQSAQDNDELSPRSQCQDGVDNDGDGLVDLNDPGCSNGQDNTEGDETARLAVGVECVMDNTDGTKTAYFSYNNVTAQALTVPVGSSGALVNTFSPGLPDQGQPTSFVPGVAKGVVAVPLASGGVTWTVRASGSAVSTATASAASPKCGSVQPLIECQGYDAGQLRAQSGYVNPNPFDVKLNFGSLNFFSPGAIDQGQPTVFKSGLNKGSFGVVLLNPATPLVWELNGQKVSASNSLSVCTGECIDTAVGEIRGELDDIAVQIAQLTIDAAEVLASADDAGASASKGKRRRARSQAVVARDRADAERAKAKAQSYVTQSKALTIQFPDVVKNCPEAPQYCETVDRGPVIAQLRALYAEARNTAQRTMARAYFKQTGSTNRRDALVRKAKQLEAQGGAELDKLPRTETVCK